MPQLDRIIVFSQIFWLFFVFSIFYITLIHYFLPVFLKSLKLRKQVININTLEVTKKMENILKKQNLFKKILLKDLEITSDLLINYFGKLVTSKKSFDMLIIDQKICRVVLNIAKFCDSKLLDSIFLYPKLLNYKE
uniref:ATP synthase F0 subunit 8 n=1 Tax=Hydropuntia eucheumatoides TaxID=172970 RepID=UPI002E77A648|nr:ATP synthase F0 subunit 8 [Gracilaria eucheumatoides]WPS66078.1 ATP synthase F0 subunit 8 [Gracilaria eucheumatoides]